MDKPSVLERTKHGREIIEDAMNILITVYTTIPKDDLDDTPVEIPASRVLEILEMFFAYIDENEDIDIQQLVTETDMSLLSNVILDDDDKKKVH